MGQVSSTCHNLWLGLLDLPGQNHTAFLAVAEPEVLNAISVANGNIEVTWPQCVQICGNFVSFFGWNTVNAIATTWFFPLFTLLVQLRYESNEKKRNLRLCSRWCGTPICALASLLQRLKDDADSAIMADQLAGDNEGGAAFMLRYRQHRDSFFLISVMNQYSLTRTDCPFGLRLLNDALFSDRIGKRDLRKLRSKTARELRELQHKGAVPLFLALGVTFICLGVAIGNGRARPRWTLAAIADGGLQLSLPAPSCRAWTSLASPGGSPSSLRPASSSEAHTRTKPPNES